MEFDFDTGKSQNNKQKHEVDFVEAQQLWNDPYRLVIPARSVDEERWVIIARIKDSYWSAIYTIRNNVVRIISVRKARNNEKELYQS